MKCNKVIIYDDNCPLCSLYTIGFVAAGMITNDNRKNFSTVDSSLLELIDTNRCRNEIPVIDLKNSQVWYGIEGLSEIIQQRLPFLKPVIDFRPVNWILNKTYNLISYNRRVIVARKTTVGNFDCTPDFNFRYRLLFMLLFIAFNTFMLYPIQINILANSSIRINQNELQALHFMLVISNIAIAYFLHPRVAIEFLGQVNMLALTTVLLTIPLIFLNKFCFADLFINNYYLSLLTLFVFVEYRRRMDYAGIIKNYPIIVVLNILALLVFIICLFNKINFHPPLF
ncbi:MAG: hypothetical protein ABIO04_14420 [Ferruginibacter sp.]